MSMSFTLADLESGAPNRPPKLINGDNFEDWKRRLKAFFLYTDHTRWESVEKGPHVPVTTVGEASVKNTNPETYNERDKKLVDRDNKAFGALILCLSSEIHNRFGDQKNAKELYDALCEFYDGNADLQKDKGVQAQKDFNSFMGLRNEKIADLTNRFLTVTSNLKKYDEDLTTVEQVTKLLDSLPPEWSLQVRMLKQERRFSEYKLMDVINKLKSFELDIKRREYNQAAYPPMQTHNAALLSSTSEAPIITKGLPYITGCGTSEVKTTSKDLVQPQIPTDMMALFGMFVNSYEALIAGDIKGKGITMEDMLQVDPDDLEEADIQWQMAMLTVRARRFMERTGKRNFGNQNSKVGFDKSKLRCFNCKQLGHFKRDCTLPTVFETPSSTSRNVTAPERETTTTMPLSQTALITNFDWSAEIAEVQEDINHALVAETSMSVETESAKVDCEVVDCKKEEAEMEKKDEKECENEKEEEMKKNTPACNCDRALATEKVIMGLPYEVIQDMCSSACRVRLFAIYKANRDLLTNQAELTTINSDLKKNEVNYYVKLNEALQELDHLNRKLLEKNVEVNMLEERVKLAEFESSKLQTKLDKWTIAGMKREELNSRQRGARIKSGIGYNEVSHVYPPPSTFCYSPIPKPHPKNDLIPENTNNLFAGLEGINHQEVREEYGYGASTGLGCSSSSFQSNSK